MWSFVMDVAMLVYLEKSFALQIQEVMCELKGAGRLGGKKQA